MDYLRFTFVMIYSTDYHAATNNGKSFGSFCCSLASTLEKEATRNETEY